MIRYAFLAVMIGAALVSCGSASAAETVSESAEAAPVVSAWYAYWDLGGAKEAIGELSDGLRGLSAFAACFGEDDELIVPDGLTDFSAELKADYAYKDILYYLSFVNDISIDGVTKLKDTDVLRRIFADDLSMQAHIDDVIKTAVTNAFGGIEIDYEAIRGDNDLWSKFMTFCGRLNEQATAENLKVRVILEPNIPFDTLAFPEGLEYAVMCYNLYGYDEKAGSKADDEFLRGIMAGAAALPGEVLYAISDEGFEWADGGTPVSIKSEAAAKLAEENGAIVDRSGSSGALTFQYRDTDGLTHTVWYADSETLERWRRILSDGGKNSVMLWYAG